MFNPNNPPKKKVVATNVIRVSMDGDSSFVPPRDDEIVNACDKVASDIRSQGYVESEIREVRGEWMVVEISLLVEAEEPEL